jgi:hypothetical protein
MYLFSLLQRDLAFLAISVTRIGLNGTEYKFPNKKDAALQKVICFVFTTKTDNSMPVK